jgi:hypothetical protein
MNKPTAIIVDLDGTLALNDHGRAWFGPNIAVEQDAVNEPIRRLIEALSSNSYILIVTGRSDELYQATKNWLDQNNIFFDPLFMRKSDDFRPDEIIKEEIYREHIEPHYDVWFVLDDRTSVVKMWRRIGLTCLQVAEGDF